MNAIGRVFIVLNLGLASTFVAFAGTYLQRDNHWKEEYGKIEKQAKLDKDDLTKRLEAAKNEEASAQRTSSAQQAQINQLQNEVKEKDAENKRLAARLGAMESAWTKTESYMATVSSKIETAVADASASQKMAIAAQKQADDAVAAKNAADKALSTAQFEIKNHLADIADKKGLIAKHEATIKEKDVLLGIANQRFPGIFTTLHPHVAGTVSHISATGSLLTIDIKSGGDQLKAGHTFAIFNPTEGYKGEAVVTDIDTSKKHCFTRVTLKAGAKPAVGDQASTDVSVSGN